jgi:hypothetical protein
VAIDAKHRAPVRDMIDRSNHCGADCRMQRRFRFLQHVIFFAQAYLMRGLLLICSGIAARRPSMSYPPT